MWLTDSRLGRLLTAFTDHLILNVLWLLGCVPLVTAPAATAALFEVTRLRQRGDEPGIARAFLAASREHFRRALLLGVGWLVVACVLVLDVVIGNRMSGTVGTAVTIVIYAALLVFALASLALFPVLVSFDAPLRQILKTTILVPLLFPGRSVASLLVTAAAVLVVASWPVSVLLAVAVTASLVQRLHRGAFNRIAQRVAEAGVADTGSRSDEGVSVALPNLKDES